MALFHRMQAIHAFTHSGEPGVLLAFVGDPGMGASRLQMSYRLKDQQTFHTKFMVCNRTAGDLVYDFFVLIDYQRQRYSLDGKAADAHGMVLSKDECKVSLLDVPALGAGNHDMMLVGTRRESERSSFSPPDFGLIVHRATLSVSGEARFPDQAPTEAGGGKYQTQQ